MLLHDVMESLNINLDFRFSNIPAVLTNDDESGGLEELLVSPGRVLCLQDITDSVVLPQPQGGVHGEPWQ